MLYKIKIFVIGVALLFPVLCFAQFQHFKSGYILDAKGDTINGKLRYTSWKAVPEEVEFKKTENDAPQSLAVLGATGFGIKNKVSYQRFTAPVSVNWIMFTNPTFGTDTVKHLKLVFLRKMLKGPSVELWSFSDAIKTRYYFIEPGATPQEFAYGLYTYDDGKTAYSRDYRFQLTYLAQKYHGKDAKLQEKIRLSDYTEKDFMAIMKVINSGRN